MSQGIKGIAFEISDLIMAQAWAAENHVRMVIRLDHGMDDEDYEEVIAIHTNANACLLLMWRDQDAVFVQPLPGRRLSFMSVAAALEKLVVNHAEAAGH